MRLKTAIKAVRLRLCFTSNEFPRWMRGGRGPQVDVLYRFWHTRQAACAFAAIIRRVGTATPGWLKSPTWKFHRRRTPPSLQTFSRRESRAFSIQRFGASRGRNIAQFFFGEKWVVIISMKIFFFSKYLSKKINIIDDDILELLTY